VGAPAPGATPEGGDPAALVVGPTGLAVSNAGTLYVADSAGNRIAAVPNALTREHPAWMGRTVTRNGALNVPLGLTLAPDGDVLTVNAGDGRLVETTPGGHQVGVRWLDTSGSPAGSGALFGLAVKPNHRAVYFVDDATNQLDLLHWELATTVPGRCARHRPGTMAHAVLRR
jgi:DNA-binding beta-propeller fold protein YncE